MVQIVPTVLTNKISELKEKLIQLQGLVDWIHLDIMDGKFVANKTISLKDLKPLKLLKKFKLGIHLITADPIKLIKEVKEIKAQKVIGQIEMMPSQEEFVKASLAKKIKPGLALDLETTIDKLNPKVLTKTDTLLLMTVKAGWGGQEFKKERLTEIKKLKALKEKKGFRFKIAIDGGINEKTIKDCFKAGAEILAVGSAVWKSKDIGKTIKYWQSLTKNEKN